jgi:2-C-methyl-D-erythritol 4-phosphate cytidylyltransferase
VTRAFGVVPLIHDDREAPAACAALRTLRTVPLVRRAVGALVRSGRVGLVLVPVPPALSTRVAELLADLTDPGGFTDRSDPSGPDAFDVPATEIRVLPVHENGPGARTLAALRVLPEIAQRPGRPRPGTDDIVVVHDPLHPLAPAALVQAVVDALAAAPAASGPAGVVPVRPVTDTLKWVDEDDVVTGTADREGFRMVYSPQAYRMGVLQAVLEAADPQVLRARGAELIPTLVQCSGGRLLTVPAPGEVFRVAGTDDLVLAEAMLHVGADLDDERVSR